MYNKIRQHIFITLCCILTIYATDTEAQPQKMGTPKNIIFIVGDGMGIAQVSASIIAEGKDNSAFIRFPYSGFSRTNSKNKYTTDSGAGGSALMTGHKVNNYAISQSPEGIAHLSFLTQAKSLDKKCGVVVTSSILDATPASTYAHVSYRKEFDSISMQLARSEFDFIAGGGYKYFLPENRKDSMSPIDTLQRKGYSVVYTLDEMQECTDSKICALLTKGDPPKASQRNEMLCRSVTKALSTLSSNNKEGFVLMIEGSQIDWACHNNNASYLLEELSDFEKMLHIVLDFAEKDGETLVVVTADHESGGLTLPDGDIDNNINSCKFSSLNHTGTMVPVFSFGPGSHLFCGIQQNTDIATKIKLLMGLSQ